MTKYLVIDEFRVWKSVEVELPTDDFEEAKDMWYAWDWGERRKLPWKVLEEDYLDTTFESAE